VDWLWSTVAAVAIVLDLSGHILLAAGGTTSESECCVLWLLDA